MMLETVIDVYIPVIGWTLLGFLLWQSPLAVWTEIPRWLSRLLYWVGVPLQVLAFVLQSPLSSEGLWVPVVVVASLAIGLAIAWGVCWRWPVEEQGSFLLAATIGNTGFVGLAIAPYLVSAPYLGWVVLFSLTHNIVGSYGVGVWLASSFGQKNQQKPTWVHLRSLFTTPALWAFGLGIVLQQGGDAAVETVQQFLNPAVQWVPPVAFIFVGVLCQQIREWHLWRRSLLAAGIKTLVMPLILGLGLRLLGWCPMPTLGMVLEAGMPTALATIILAQEYAIAQSELIVLSLAASSVGVLVAIPLWLWLFGGHGCL
ncbi:MAG: AEC family transporter [Oscillatoriales cyanobacterium SM2_2_1]|nr:AEC family transporter [Oscillatoriales cyanobacterium SM2_2_1]